MQATNSSLPSRHRIASSGIVARSRWATAASTWSPTSSPMFTLTSCSMSMSTCSRATLRRLAWAVASTAVRLGPPPPSRYSAVTGSTGTPPDCWKPNVMAAGYPVGMPGSPGVLWAAVPHPCRPMIGSTRTGHGHAVAKWKAQVDGRDRTRRQAERTDAPAHPSPELLHRADHGGIWRRQGRLPSSEREFDRTFIEDQPCRYITGHPDVRPPAGGLRQSRRQRLVDDLAVLLCIEQPGIPGLEHRCGQDRHHVPRDDILDGDEEVLVGRAPVQPMPQMGAGPGHRHPPRQI